MEPQILVEVSRGFVSLRDVEKASQCLGGISVCSIALRGWVVVSFAFCLDLGSVGMLSLPVFCIVKGYLACAQSGCSLHTSVVLV